jgi:arylsulfatase A-like enzyme
MASALSLIASAGAVLAAERKGPNVLILMADQLRFQSCGFSDPRAITPNIDRLAREGMLFRNFAASTPVCSAFRASLLTGKYASSTGVVVNELRMNPNHDTFAHVLKAAGYRTDLIGKWHLWSHQAGGHEGAENNFVPPGPYRLGFDDFWAAFNFGHDNYRYSYWTDSPQELRGKEFMPIHFTNLAIEQIKRHAQANEPFAMVVAHSPPHDPWGKNNVPKEWYDKFADVAFPLPETWRDEPDPYMDRNTDIMPTVLGLCGQKIPAAVEGMDLSHLALGRAGPEPEFALLQGMGPTIKVDTNYGRIPKKQASSADERNTPNVVVVFTDDQGYQDVGCFGSPKIKTPNLDRMAAEGMRFTDFYVAQAVCSASRAALMTGCYSNRVGILGALGPGSKQGISDKEMTIAQLVKKRDYATAIFGKWHLGDRPQFLPTRHGFDEYFGLPYSNDMWPHHPTNGKAYPPLPLIEGEKTIATNPDQTQLTTWYTERAVKFIEKNRQRPFFLYVAHNMPHVPLFVSDKFKGKSERGLYGDVIMEIDWSVGQILETLKRLDLDSQTLVIFTSDNGPWLSYGDHAGSALPLREGKGTMFDGGCRVPCIMRWPGKIPAGRMCNELAATIDVLPTIAGLIGVELPKDRVIDGRDIWPLMEGRPGAKSPHEAYYCYWNRELQAVRSRQWKLHFPHDYRTLAGAPGSGGKPGPYRQAKIGAELFDLSNDIEEKVNLADKHPEVVRRLEALAEQAREDLGDSLTKRPGKNVREAGRVVEGGK